MCRCRYDCEFWMMSEYLNGVIKLPFCFHLQRFNKQTKMFHFVENSSAFFLNSGSDVAINNTLRATMWNNWRHTNTIHPKYRLRRTKNKNILDG